MPTINQLAGLSQVSGGDQLPIYVPNNGDARKVSVSQLLQYFQQTFAAPTVATNLYTPGTGFNITVPTPTSEQQWMLIQPASALASGTVTLPLNTGVPDGTQVLITTTQEITAFTLALNGAAAGFAIKSLSLSVYFRSGIAVTNLLAKSFVVRVICSSRKFIPADMLPPMMLMGLIGRPPSRMTAVCLPRQMTAPVLTLVIRTLAAILTSE